MMKEYAYIYKDGKWKMVKTNEAIKWYEEQESTE